MRILRKSITLSYQRIHIIFRSWTRFFLEVLIRLNVYQLFGVQYEHSMKITYEWKLDTSQLALRSIMSIWFCSSISVVSAPSIFANIPDPTSPKLSTFLSIMHSKFMFMFCPVGSCRILVKMFFPNKTRISFSILGLKFFPILVWIYIPILLWNYLLIHCKAYFSPILNVFHIWIKQMSCFLPE